MIGARALGGFLAGIIVVGQLLAVFMANSGGAWDNAKKQIEDEPSDPEKNLGKFSERHKAGVIGDTVGDPLKDTAGPALNPMIKVVNLVSLLIAPIIINVAATGGSLRTITLIISGASLVALAIGIIFSMREAKEVIE
jgi:K(+)-stimulated pyrophosphate-energized sodium pump